MSNYEFFDAEIYSVEVIDGEKYVHIDGYFYKGDDGINHVQYIGCYIPLGDGKVEQEDIDDAECDAKMMQEDGLKLSEMVRRLNGYYGRCSGDGEGNVCPEALPLAEVDKNTPEGFYMNISI